MNMTRHDKLQGIDERTAYNILTEKFGRMEVYRELFYYSWPQTFGNTAGPFSRPGRLSGQAMTTFQMECWSDGCYALVFCCGEVVHIFEHGNTGRFNVEEYRNSSAWRDGK